MKSFITWPQGEIESIKVVDGDTLKLKMKQMVSVRLSRIDCPDRRNKEGWLKAKKYVQDKVQKAKEIKITATQRGKYGRYLVEVFVDGKNLNNELMEQGIASKYGENKKRT